MVITRFSPSPTGFLHLGSARTAAFAYAYAKQMGGKFILRIEDSDPARSTHESLLDILNGLEWLGIKFDEAPSKEEIDKEIYSEKFFQSKRLHIHQEYIDKLVNDDKAYINDEGVTVFKMPKENVTVHDEILGDVIYKADQLQDFPIRRANGSVLFHAAVVIDDALSGVTHIIRANDHLTNTPKHIRLYEALGFKVPVYAHMPLILDDKGAKLSKRRTDQSVLIRDFMKEGFLPDSVCNILGLMGWKNPERIEEFGLEYMCQNFDIKDCSKVNARYDVKKMMFLNANRIARMSNMEFFSAVGEYGNIFHHDEMEKIGLTGKSYSFFSMIKSRCKTLKDPFVNYTWFYDKPKEFSEKDVNKVIPDIGAIHLILDRLSYISWERQDIMEGISDTCNTHNLTLNKCSQALRLTVTGGLSSPPIDETLHILGKQECIERMKIFLDKYGPKPASV